jgi:hypothetical protein
MNDLSVRSMFIGRLGALVFVAALAACAGHTVNGTTSRSPYNDLSIDVVSNGAAGRAYSERSEKRVYVSIYVDDAARRQFLMRKDYLERAADLKWKVQWISPDQVQVTWIEVPEGASEREIAKDMGKATPVRIRRYSRVSPGAFQED